MMTIFVITNSYYLENNGIFNTFFHVEKYKNLFIEKDIIL